MFPSISLNKQARSYSGAFNKRVFLAIISTLILISLFVFVTAAQALTATEVAKGFICNCGCQKNLEDCSSTMKECGIGQDLVKIIAQKVSAGEPKAQITSYMMKNYGEKILTAPTKRGFNLVGWLSPFVATAAAAALIYITIFRWARQTPKLARINKKPGAAKDKYSKKLDDELKKFDY